METTMDPKPDKRTKEYKQTKESNTQPTGNYELLKSAGIPIKMAMFKVPVKFLGDAPETAYYDPTDKAKPAKSATMFMTPHGLLCEKKEQKMIVPLANVGYALTL